MGFRKRSICIIGFLQSFFYEGFMSPILGPQSSYVNSSGSNETTAQSHQAGNADTKAATNEPLPSWHRKVAVEFQPFNR